MLVRDLGDAFQIVLQPDHGEVCGQLAAAWRYENSLEPPLRAALIRAAARHDDGWSVYERHPGLDEQGRPASFLTAPLEPLLSSYTAAVDVMSIEDPLAALLVSMHVSGLRRRRYGVLEGGPAAPLGQLEGPVRGFVLAEEARQRRLVAELGVGEQELRHAYRVLQILDVLSLHLGLAELTREERTAGDLGLAPGPRAGTVRCVPWPFREASLRVSLRRRIVPGRRWEDVEAFRAAFRAAAVEAVPLDLLHG